MNKPIGKTVLHLVIALAIFAPLSTNVSAQDFVTFSVKSEKLIIGEYSTLKFSSTSNNNGSIKLSINLNGKQLTGHIPESEEENITISGIIVKNGNAAKLEQKDVVELTTLYISLQRHLDKQFLAHKMLDRFISYFLNFHSVNEYVSMKPLSDDERLSNRDQISPFSSTDICDLVGETIKGEYVIPKEFVDKGFECGDAAISTEEIDGDFSCAEFEVVGADPCIGGCGKGCSSVPFKGQAFTQECFDYDLCARATGDDFEKNGPCGEEFSTAINSFFKADDCKNELLEANNIGTWIGDWILVNFLADDDNGVWDEDGTSGIGIVATITENGWIETDKHGDGCAITYVYSVKSNNRHSKQAIRKGSKCRFWPPARFIKETGRLEFSSDNNFMIENFDPKPFADIVAFKWMRQ